MEQTKVYGSWQISGVNAQENRVEPKFVNESSQSFGNHRRD